MILDLLVLAVFAALGVLLQRRPSGPRLRDRLWALNIAVVIPFAAFYALLGADLDAHLLAVAGCGVAGWWATVAIAATFARVVTHDVGAARTALTLVGAFPNTGFIGFPLALLLFGDAGLRTAVLFDQVSLVVPAIVVATVLARRSSRTDLGDDDEAPALLGEVLASPPLWAVAATLLLRVSVQHDPVDLHALGQVIGHVVGPIGFVLLGLSIPLERATIARRDLAGVVGATVIRLAVAPIAVWSVATATGTHVPAALLFVAGLPTAFHALIVSRVYDTRPDLVRAGIILTTVLALVVSVPIAAGLG